MALDIIMNYATIIRFAPTVQSVTIATMVMV